MESMIVLIILAQLDSLLSEHIPFIFIVYLFPLEAARDIL